MLIKNSNRQIFYINSYSRTSGTNSNFTYKLNIDTAKNYNKVVLLQASIPKTMYMISSTTNTFILQENGSNIIITVPPGNYNKSSFQVVVSNLLTAQSTHGWTYAITTPNVNIAADTGLYTITVSNNSSQPSLIFTGGNNYCYENLGFNANSTNLFVANTLVSTNTINFSLESTLFIHSNICQNKLDNVLQEIYTPGVSFNSFVKYDCTCPKCMQRILLVSLTHISFY